MPYRCESLVLLSLVGTLTGIAVTATPVSLELEPVSVTSARHSTLFVYLQNENRDLPHGDLYLSAPVEIARGAHHHGSVATTVEPISARYHVLGAAAPSGPTPGDADSPGAFHLMGRGFEPPIALLRVGEELLLVSAFVPGPHSRIIVDDLASLRIGGFQRRRSSARTPH